MWVLLTLLSAITFGIKDVLIKKYTLKKKISPYSIVMYEFLISIIILPIFLFSFIDFKKFLTVGLNEIYLFFTTALTLMIFSVIYVKLIEEHEVSEVSPLLNLSPVFLLGLSFFILNEVISLKQFIGICIILISTYFLEHLSSSKHKTPVLKSHFLNFKLKSKKFFLLVVTMLISISISGIYFKKATFLDFNSFEIFFAMSIFSVLILIVFLLFQKKLKKTFIDMKDNPGFGAISVLAGVSLILVYYAISLPKTLVSLIVPLRRTSTFFSSIIGGFLFHEAHLKKKIIIVLFMIVGVFLIST